MQPEVTRTLRLSEKALEGTVLHQRNFDVEHSFEYRVWMALARLDNSKLPTLLRPRTKKYMKGETVAAMAGRNADANTDIDAQVWLLTQPSLIGRSFNPVSFYLVVAEEKLSAIIAHITNTPWDEEHCYVLPQQVGDTWVLDKEFHISPFLPMQLTYQWRFRITDERIAIHMQLLDDGARVFSVALNLQPAIANGWTPLRIRLSYPAQNLLTLGRIYWQAAKLKIKGAQFYAHADHTSAVHDRHP
ncbi:MAG: DUF1365 domain-containing protein [Pseudomonadota bacterium]|nr:DUF1365 domain-containing protein [Pseudomonadota bacterium]